MISTKTHAVLDYLVGCLLIIAPFAIGFTDNDAAMFTAIGAGIFTLAYSLVTDYEYSIIALIPFRVHLFIDILSGLFLIASSGLFNFHNRIYWPHVTVGMVELLVVLLSKTKRKHGH